MHKPQVHYKLEEERARTEHPQQGGPSYLSWSPQSPLGTISVQKRKLRSREISQQSHNSIQVCLPTAHSAS